jgi:uncharacterized protein with ATP-grasp and redox domains
MAPYDKPRPPIPESLRGLEVGSFAYHTIVDRLPDIARRTLQANQFPATVVKGLQAMLDEIPASPIRPLADTAAPDNPDWRRYVERFAGGSPRRKTWLETTWFFAETYFYRRILEATGYFQTGGLQKEDPFLYEKRQGLETSQEAITSLSDHLDELLGDHNRQSQALLRLLKVSLWGNQSDLSLWPSDSNQEQRPNHQDADQQQSHLLADDAQAAVDYLSGLGKDHLRVDFLLDNAGLELVNDLALADFLLSGNAAEQVRFHAKSHPTFVSDATVKDVQETINYLASASRPQVQRLGARLEGHLQANRLKLREHFFWTSPLSMWEMPEEIEASLSRSRLVISKGDANYRRLLGDRHWPFTTPLGDILGYFPAPLLVLRVLKSEVVAGLAPDQPASLDLRDPDWLVDGKWGVIQFVGSELSKSVWSEARL